MKRYLKLFLLIWLVVPTGANSVEKPIVSDVQRFQPLWYSTDSHGDVEIHFYFFWSSGCPHCRKAKPFIPTLQQRYPWLKIHAYEVDDDQDNIQLYVEMADSIGENANAVPAFLFCEKLYTGYDNEEGVGAFLKKQLETCHKKHSSSILPPSPQNNKDVTLTPLPWIGQISAEQFSLPILTLFIAGLDAFNPCAFFVLLFLLSLLIHTHQRSRMLLIGGIFVFFSGLIYFLFMAAWLNVFLLMGELYVVTLLAGGIAVIVALINIKDFFWFKQGVSLTIPEQAKPTLYQRMRGLVTSTNLLPLIISTVTLAIVANAYELLCTAGFPMVYTRILTLNHLATSTYYLYLVLYNIIYVIPLFVIVLIITYTLGSRKLAEAEGRALKLMSGLMMLGLGGILLIEPQLLTNLKVAISILAVAIGTGVLVIVWEKRHQQTC